MASTMRFDNWQTTDGTSIATTNASGDITASGKLSISGELSVPNLPIISGRMGSSGTQTSDSLVLFDEFWVQQGITYNSSTRRFTVPESGVYRIVFNVFYDTSVGAGRVLVGVNTDTPDKVSNYGHSYREEATYENGAINSVVSLNADDYIVFRIFTGTLYNNTIDRFNDFNIQRIA